MRRMNEVDILRLCYSLVDWLVDSNTFNHPGGCCLILRKAIKISIQDKSITFFDSACRRSDAGQRNCLRSGCAGDLCSCRRTGFLGKRIRRILTHVGVEAVNLPELCIAQRVSSSRIRNFRKVIRGQVAVFVRRMKYQTPICNRHRRKIEPFGDISEILQISCVRSSCHGTACASDSLGDDITVDRLRDRLHGGRYNLGGKILDIKRKLLGGDRDGYVAEMVERNSRAAFSGTLFGRFACRIAERTQIRAPGLNGQPGEPGKTPKTPQVQQKSVEANPKKKKKIAAQ